MEHYKNLDLADIKYFCEFDQIEKTEQWVSVKGLENEYNISDLGRIKSIPRFVKFKNSLLFVKEKILSQSIDGTKYLNVSLRKEGKRVNGKIHTVVVNSFMNKNVGRKYKNVVDHKNNISTDNRLCNLQVITNRENLTKDKKSLSSFVGVHRHSGGKFWQSSIRKGNKSIYLGIFKSEQEASNAYNNALEDILKREQNEEETILFI